MKLHSSKKPATISQSRWLAYATAGLATAAVNLPSAEAEIHYSGQVRLHMSGHQDQSIFGLPLAPYAHLEFWRGQNFSGPGEYDFVIVSASKVHSLRVSNGFGNYIANLRANVDVSSGKFFGGVPAWLIAYSGGYFRTPGIGFFGFKFDSGSGLQYGWARIRTNKGGADNALTVLDYAYADPGEPIKTGQTSENEYLMRPPAEESLGALALGAVGLAAWRKSRRGN